MKLLLRKLKSLVLLSNQQKYFVLRVFVLSIYRNVLLLSGSKKAFTEHIYKNQNVQTALTAKQIAMAKDIAKAISIVNKYVPWKNVCRHQSWQAVCLLLEYHIPFEYYVGISKEKTKIEGHSWVKVNQKFICGKCNENDYLVINKKVYS
jgi:hypothetical protein